MESGNYHVNKKEMSTNKVHIIHERQTANTAISYICMSDNTQTRKRQKVTRWTVEIIYKDIKIIKILEEDIKQ